MNFLAFILQIVHIIVFQKAVRNTYVWGLSHLCIMVKPQPFARMRHPFSYLISSKTIGLCRLQDVCATTNFTCILTHLGKGDCFAYEQTYRFASRGTSPVASLLAVGASKALSLVAPNGETSLSPNLIDQPCAVWMHTSLSPLDHEQGACLPLCKPSLYPRDQPSAVWMPPLHGDHWGVSQPLWTPSTM